MSLYKYMAAGPGESPREMLIEADSSSEALAKLRSRRLTPVRFMGEETVSSHGGVFFHRRKIDTFEFTRQLSPLLSAYIPLERALSIIAEGAEEEDQKNFVNELRQGLHEGRKFSELVRSHGSVFPNYYANLVESGEESGCLPEVLSELYKFMNESRELKSFISTSSIYPLAIFGVTMAVTLLMFTVLCRSSRRSFGDGSRASGEHGFSYRREHVFFMGELVCSARPCDNSFFIDAALGPRGVSLQTLLIASFRSADRAYSRRS